MKVDIIMRTKDRTIFLERAIKDVMAQSYENWFLCIVNDGGKSSEVDKLVKKYKSHAKQIKVIHHAKSKGMEAASNAGIKSTNGELIVIHDDDDTWHPDFLKKCVAKLQEPMDYADVGGVAVKTQMIYEKIKGTKIKIIKKGLPRHYQEASPCILLTEIAKNNQIPVMSFVYYRKCLKKVGYYDENLPVSGDWDFHLRFLLNYEVLFLDELLAFYHKRVSASGALANSVSNWNKIVLYDSFVRHKYIREDIKNNKVGLGNILAQAEFFKKLEKDLPVTFKINRLLKRIKRFILRR